MMRRTQSSEKPASFTSSLPREGRIDECVTTRYVSSLFRTRRRSNPWSLSTSNNSQYRPSSRVLHPRHRSLGPPTQFHPRTASRPIRRQTPASVQTKSVSNSSFPPARGTFSPRRTAPSVSSEIPPLYVHVLEDYDKHRFSRSASAAEGRCVCSSQLRGIYSFFSV